MLENEEKNVLYNLYINEGLTRKQIADNLDKTLGYINHKLKCYEIRKSSPELTERRIRRRRTKVSDETLLDLCINQKKTAKEISKILDINSITVSKRLNKLGINFDTIMDIHYNLQNKEFGILKVVCLDELQDQLGSRIWLCQCDCGKYIRVTTGRLTAGEVKCCGDSLCKRKYSKNWKGYEEIWGSHWYSIKRCAEVRNLEFTITIEEAWGLYLKQDRKCALSGKELKFGRIHHVDTKNASLDRIDSNKPYTKDNCQWVDIQINLMKQDLGEEEFINLCGLVWINSKGKLNNVELV